jgi:hypothetical protein
MYGRGFGGGGIGRGFGGGGGFGGGRDAASAARQAAAAEALARLPVPDVGALVAGGAAALVRRHPIKLGLNCVGLLLLFFAAGYAPSKAAEARYAAALPSAALLSAERAAGAAAAEARAAYSGARGWFWSCDDACGRARRASEAADARWAAAREATSAAVRAAKGELGLFSRSGVEETRDQFWASFAGGAAYAKRATLWDALFVGMRSMGRDEPLLSFVFQMAMRALANLTVGIAGGVLHFSYAVIAIIRSYNPNVVAGVLFWALCVLAGASFFATAVATIFGGTALALAGGATLLRIAAQQQQQQPRRVRGHEE